MVRRLWALCEDWVLGKKKKKKKWQVQGCESCQKGEAWSVWFLRSARTVFSTESTEYQGHLPIIRLRFDLIFTVMPTKNRLERT